MNILIETIEIFKNLDPNFWYGMGVVLAVVVMMVVVFETLASRRPYKPE